MKEIFKQRSRLILVILASILTFTIISGGYFIVTKDLYGNKVDKSKVQAQNVSNGSDQGNDDHSIKVSITPTPSSTATATPVNNQKNSNNGNNNTSTPTPTPTSAHTPTTTPTITVTPSPTPTVGHPPDVTPSPYPTFSPTITPTPSPTFVATPTPTPTATLLSDLGFGANTGADFNNHNCKIDMAIRITNFGPGDVAIGQAFNYRYTVRHVESNTILKDVNSYDPGSIPAGATDIIDVTSSSYGAGHYEVTYSIDWLQAIPEANESNNTFTTTFFTPGACII